MMEFKPAIDQFLDHLKTGKRYSLHTITSYGNDLEQLRLYLWDHYDLDSTLECQSVHLRSFLVEMLNSGLSPRSVNRKVSAIRQLFSYLLRKNIISGDVTEKLIPPKTPKRLPSFVRESDMQKLEGVIHVDGFEEIRDHAIVDILYHTGMRRSELINLSIDDISFSERKIKVMGKGGKERFIPMSGSLAEIIEKYLAARRKSFPSIRGGSLILTGSGKKAYPKLIYNSVRKVLGFITTSSRRGPHILRHTFASHLLNNGADLNAIKEILGHANLSATQVYTHNSITKLREAYRKAHPKGGT